MTPALLSQLSQLHRQAISALQDIEFWRDFEVQDNITASFMFKAEQRYMSVMDEIVIRTPEGVEEPTVMVNRHAPDSPF